MPLLNRKRILLAKVETTYGTDAGPTGAANAILVRNLDMTPLDADIVARDLVRPYLGNMDQLIAGTKVSVSCEVELQGSGTAGSAPAYGPLLRACGLSETILAAALTGSAVAATATTITLAAGASSSDGAYVGLPITITSGTGSGSVGTCIGYDGTTKVATVASWGGTAPAAASGYSVGAGVVYKPISSLIESVTIWGQMQDATAGSSPTHKITGCRGNAEWGLSAKGIPVIKFQFTGVYNAPADVANLSATFTGFKAPLAVNRANTPVFSVFGHNAVASDLSVNLNNEIVYRNLIGSESVLLTDRKAGGSVTIEAPTITTKDFFAAAIGGTLGSLVVTHGVAAGYIVDIVAPASVDLTTPSYGDQDGITMMTLPFVLVPTSGNDEFAFVVR